MVENAAVEPEMGLRRDSFNGGEEIVPSDELGGELDIDVVFRRIPVFHTLKGLFYNAHVARLGDHYASVRDRLIAPPQLGRYIPFSSYPLADHALLFLSAARLRFPDVSLPEAARRSAREDMTTLLGSMLGKMLEPMIPTPREGLRQFPEVYRRVCTGPRASLAGETPTSVSLRLERVYAGAHYQLGQMEGLLMHYGVSSIIRVERISDNARIYHVSWR